MDKEDEILSEADLIEPQDIIETEPQNRPCINNGKIEQQSMTCENKSKAFLKYFNITANHIPKWDPSTLFYILKMYERQIDFEKVNVELLEEMMRNSSLPFMEWEYQVIRSLPNILDISQTMSKQKTLKRIGNLEFVPGYVTEGLHFGVYGLRHETKNHSLLAIDIRNLKRNLDRWLLYTLFGEDGKMIHQNEYKKAPEKVLEFMETNGLQICCKRRSLNNLYILNCDETKNCDNISVKIFRLESAKFQNHLAGKHYCRFQENQPDSWETVKKQKRE